MNRVPSPETVLKLAQQHIDRFTYRVTMARAGHKGYREEECIRYLKIWQSIQHKQGRWENLTRDERIEVGDALVELEEDE